MPGNKRKLPIPQNQLTLIDIEPTTPKQKEQNVPKQTANLKKQKVPKRTPNLEQRVTLVEAEVTLLRAQVERELEPDEDEDDIKQEF